MKSNMYEITKQERVVGTIGREMMDYSETSSMAKLKDKEIAVFNMQDDSSGSFIWSY
jgi:hypothetical protein